MNIFDNIYVLHIPKTAGRYIKQNLEPFFKYLDKVHSISFNSDDPQEVNTNHDGWHKKINDNTYIITSFRDPIFQAISYYAHGKSFTVDFERRVPVGAAFINKNDFLIWLENNNDNMKNNQSKNLLFGKVEGRKSFLGRNGFPYPEEYINFETFTYQDVLERIKRINIFVRTSNIDLSLITNKILEDMSLTKEFVFQESIPAKTYLNEDVLRIYNDLTEKEKNKIYQLNDIDTAIWNNEYLFTKFGE